MMEILEKWGEYVFDIVKEDQEVILAFGRGLGFLRIKKGSYYIRKLEDDEDMSKLVKGVKKMTVVDFLMKVESIIKRYNGSVTSWIRSKDRNQRKGGHEDSRHLYGWAVDVKLDRVSDVPEFIHECTRQGLVAIDGGNHVHVQTI